MPRLLIRDAHEWINEIPTVPSYHLANQLRQGNGLEWLSGERRPCWVWLQSQFVGRHRRCSYRWEACRFWKTTSFIVALQIQWKGKGGYGSLHLNGAAAIRGSSESPSLGILNVPNLPLLVISMLLVGVWAFVWKQDWDGEFGWGGISAKHQRRCPKASSVRTETSRGAQGQKLAWS